MEKKVYFWASLIVGVPLLRVIEVLGVGYATSGMHASGLFEHIALGLIIGAGCALASNMIGLTNRKTLWVLPLLAIAYATLLLVPSYPRNFFHQDPTYVSTLLVMDLGSWAIAVFGAAFVGYVISRPAVGSRVVGTRLVS